MSILVNEVCSSREDFEDYKHRLESCTKDTSWKRSQHGERDAWIWPALIITLITFDNTTGQKMLTYVHTNISRQKLLQILKPEEFNYDIKFEPQSIEFVPEIFETREI
jgi:hypothetical protein